MRESEGDASSSLRGWLSDVYLPALVDGGDAGREALAVRLGSKATIDDPRLGLASGREAIAEHLRKTAEWLAGARFEKHAVTVGVDRDVTEGVLTIGKASLPIAVVAERRKEREVAIRLYFSHARATTPVPAPADPTPLPPVFATHAAALAAGDVAAALTAFEARGTLVDGGGQTHTNEDGAVGAYLTRLVAGAPLVVTPRGSADDGRTFALECVLSRAGATEHARAVLLAYERGDSGLVRALRIYGDDLV